MRAIAVRRIGAILLGLGLLSSLGVAPVLGAGIVVNSLGNTAANDGFCTLREAIPAANLNTASGGAIGECAAGSGADVITFSVSGTISLVGGSLFPISGDLSIVGAGAITVDGAGSWRVFEIDAGTVTLSGLTISGGVAANGAGVLNLGGNLTIIDSTITQNSGSGPGSAGIGIFSSGSGVSLTVTHSLISLNSTTGLGGGIYNNGPLTVTDSSVSGNTAGAGGGGGIYIADGTASITRSTIDQNATSGNGGGIDSGESLTVTDSTLNGNAALFGGGIYNPTGGSLTVTNSTANNNSANIGGGIFSNGAASITNSTLSGNTAPGGGGGIFRAAGGLVVTGSTISGNTAGAGGGIVSQGSGAAAITNSTISGNTASGNGGGILNVSPATITNSTISDNTSGSVGGGISAQGNETIVNTIVAGNSAVANDEVGSGAVETTTTSIIGVPGGKTLADILVPAGLADNGGPTQTIALALVAGNPAIDTATGATCAASPVNAVDQRGMPRPAACDIGAYEAQPPTVAAHAPVSAPATSASGAVVTYTPPAGTNEQGVAASVACLPASGSAFAVGTTTVTCTATDAVGHTGTGTFQVTVGSFVPPTPVLPNTVVPEQGSTTIGLLTLLGVMGLLGYLGLWRAAEERRRRS